MIILNVLPPSLKEEFKLNRLKALVRFVASIVIAIAAFGGGLVLAELWVSNLYTQATEEASTALKSNQEILEFNSKVKRIEGVQAVYLDYSDIMAPIMNAIPIEVNIKEISFDGEHKLVTIEGDTEKKDLIFETKENMQKLEVLSDVRLETDELITKTRKSFSIYAQIVASPL